MPETGMHSPDDNCKPKGPCRTCGRARWRHEHSCGIWSCSKCHSLDLKLLKDPDPDYDGERKCYNCGYYGAPLFMSVGERLARGA
jgi:hypothetical protein